MTGKPLQSSPRIRTLLHALIGLALLVPLWWLVGLRYEAYLLQEKRQQVQSLAATQAHALATALEHRLALLKGLKAFVDTRLTTLSGIVPAEFDALAAGLYAGTTAIRHFAVTPEGADPLVYPGPGKARGPVPLFPPQLRADLLRAARSASPVLSVPFPLRPQGIGLQATQTVRRGETTWGVVSLTLDLLPLFAETGLAPPPSALSVALRDASGRRFYGPDIPAAAQAVSLRVPLSDGFWTLTMLPQGGWAASILWPLRQFQAITLTLVLLLTLLIWVLSNDRRRLREAVRQRTGHLQRTLTDRREEELQLQQALQQLRQAMGATIDAMTAAVEGKDPASRGHHRRTADLARAIATEMRLPEAEINTVRMAASLHDVGKIALPAEILGKPARLSEAELNLVKGHPQAGYDMLNRSEFPWPVAQTVWQHHERFDGSGYPLGLKGEAILPGARILAVADVVEAMASPRAYRGAHDIGEALEEIRSQRGSLYDPEVADACLRIFREKDFRLA